MGFVHVEKLPSALSESTRASPAAISAQFIAKICKGVSRLQNLKVRGMQAAVY